MQEMLYRLAAILLVLAISLSVFSVSSSGLDQPLNHDGDTRDINMRMSRNYSFPEPVIEKDKDDHHSEISMEGLGERKLKTGHPIVPKKTLEILLPQERTVQSIDVEKTGVDTVKLRSPLEWVPSYHPIGIEDTSTSSKDKKIYDSGDPYPGTARSEPEIQFFKGYRILLLDLHPVQYLPARDKISYCSEMQLTLNLKKAEISPMFRGLRFDKKLIKEEISENEMLSTYDQSPSNSVQDHVNPAHDYDMVILTDQNLNQSTGAYTWQDLQSFKYDNGITTAIRTVGWVDSTYSGNDTQDRIRQFARDVYQNWNATYLLLGGDGDGADVGGESGDEIIPARLFFVEYTPDTTYSRHIAADCYYGLLDGTFDYDGNGDYGEPGDGAGGGEVDLYPELYVGRAPVDSETELSNFVHKTIEYRTSNSTSLNESFMAGEDLGWSVTGKDFKEKIRTGSSGYGYETAGVPDYYNVSTLYYADVGSWSSYQLINILNDDINFMNHMGHANTGSVMKLYRSDIESLTNEEYFFAYSQGCYPGSFDNQKIDQSYSSYDSIGEYFVTCANGASAVIMNSRYGWGSSTSSNGASQHYDRRFFDEIFGEGERHLGKANMLSKAEEAANISDMSELMRWCYYETNLLGDPSASLKNISVNPSKPEQPTPADGATGIGTNPTLIVNVSHPTGEEMNVSFYDASDDSLIGQNSDVHNGTTSLGWQSLSYDTSYSWYVTVHDGNSFTTSDTWTFTTGLEANSAPNEPGNPIPSNGSVGVSLNPYLEVDISDPDGDMMTVNFYNASSGSIIGTNTQVANGTTGITWDNLSEGRLYGWYAMADDGQLSNYSQTWYFSTNHLPEEPYDPEPGDGAKGIKTSPTLKVNVSDEDSDLMNVTFYDASGDGIIDVNHGVGNGTTSVTWNGLSGGSIYTWYVKVNDGMNTVRSSNWSFSTNTVPARPKNPLPADGSSGVITSPSLAVNVTDNDDDTMNVTFYDASADTVIGEETDVENASRVHTTWSGLQTGTTYEWYVVADDGMDTNRSNTWSFTTKSGNHAPLAPSNPIPEDETRGLESDITLQVDVSDPDGDSMTVTFYDALDDSEIGTKNDVENGTVSMSWNALSMGVGYDWYVTVDDGTDLTRSSTWSFMTDLPPNMPVDPIPLNSATGVSTSPLLSVNVSDPDNDSMTVSFYDASDDSQIGYLTGVENGSQASLTWSGLQTSMGYSWYAVTDDGILTNRSSTWSFTTKSGNHAPLAPEDPVPADGSTGHYLGLSLQVDVADPDGDTMNVTFYNADDDSQIANRAGVSNGSVSVTWDGLSPGTQYNWYVAAEDGIDSALSETWSFTKNYRPDRPFDPNPKDGSSGVAVTTQLRVNVTDKDNDTMNVTFYDASDDTEIGNLTGVSSGSRVSVGWNGLETGTSYSWYVVVDDGSYTNRSPTWTFTTLSNSPPQEPSDPYPLDGMMIQKRETTLGVNVSDPDGDGMNITFYNASNDAVIAHRDGVYNGTISVLWSGLSVAHTYTWYATANDSYSEVKSPDWNFTVFSNEPPSAPTSPVPSNGSSKVGLNPTLSVDISDPDGDDMSLKFYNAEDDSLIGSKSDVTNGTISITWNGLLEGTSYSWYAVADDGYNSTASNMWTFTTDNRPSYDELKPEDGAKDLSTEVQLSVRASDKDGDDLTVNFFNASDGSLIDSSNVSNGTTASVLWTGLSPNRTYSWYMVLNDGILNTTSSEFSFKTAANRPPLVPEDPSPADGTTVSNWSPELSVNVTDPDGDLMTVTFYDASSDTIIGEKNGVENGSYPSVIWSDLEPGTTHQWYVEVNDGKDTVTSPTYFFETRDLERGVDVKADMNQEEKEKGSFSYTFTVENTGNVQDTYNISLTVTDPKWSVSGPDSVTLSSGGSEDVEVQVTIPDSASKDDSVPITLTARSQNASDVKSSDTLKVTYSPTNAPEFPSGLILPVVATIILFFFVTHWRKKKRR